jgi:hypothetical protein
MWSSSLSERRRAPLTHQQRSGERGSGLIVFIVVNFETDSKCGLAKNDLRVERCS